MKAVDINYEVVRQMAKDIDIFENDSFDETEFEELFRDQSIDLKPEPHFHDKIPSILKQIGKSLFFNYLII